MRDNALFLDVPDDRTHLQELIKDYWGEQHQPEGDDPYACPRELPCASTAVVKKFYDNPQWPPVLILGLKRWRTSITGGVFRSDKINTRIDFDEDLTPTSHAPAYKLRGIIVHHGRLAGSGHYVSYVRNDSDQWFFCDDNQAPDPVSVQEVLAKEAFVLFYEVTLPMSSAPESHPPTLSSSSTRPTHVNDSETHLPRRQQKPKDSEATNANVDERSRRGVVSGFGKERTEDALGDQARRDSEQCARQRHRLQEGLRGRARDWDNNDLDRSAGGAWAFGRR